MLYFLARIFCIAVATTACCLTSSCQPAPQSPPFGFVHVKSIVRDIKYEIRYAGNNNFLGRPVKGYETPEAMLTREAAVALGAAQTELSERGYGLKIFDAYRPQRAVNDFIAWAKDLSDTINKRTFYPDVPKSELFKRGYIASRSGHSRGSTIDLTIIKLSSGRELDMGGPYDFFGEISHHTCATIPENAMHNRLLLRTVMERHGFKAYELEWWHYTLVKEPYPSTYFDFPFSSR